MQWDVHEFFNLLNDRLETCLKDSSNPNLLNETFGGVLCNEILSLETDEYPQTVRKDEPFLSLQLDIKNKSDLNAALQALTKGEILEGNNLYYSDVYNRKIKALKRMRLKNTPETLVLVLNRFEFDYNTNMRTKLNDYFPFPLMLDMSPYVINDNTDNASLDT